MKNIVVILMTLLALNTFSADKLKVTDVTKTNAIELATQAFATTNLNNITVIRTAVKKDAAIEKEISRLNYTILPTHFYTGIPVNAEFAKDAFNAYQAVSCRAGAESAICGTAENISQFTDAELTAFYNQYKSARTLYNFCKFGKSALATSLYVYSDIQGDKYGFISCDGINIPEIMRNVIKYPQQYAVINTLLTDYLTDMTTNSIPAIGYKYARGYDINIKGSTKVIDNINKFKQDDRTYLNVLIRLNKVDDVINLLLAKNSVKFSATELHDAIRLINTVEADYRKDDIVKVLKNINSKYTIELYDNPKIWDPVISKVRAMIDVRK